MPDTTQTFSASNVIQGLLLGMMLGAMGQGIRAVVGLKKAGDSAQADGSSLKDQFDAAQLLVSLLIGAIAGGLAALPLLSQLASLGYQTIIALLGAGYAGADFIEGFMSKALPSAKGPLANLKVPAGALAPTISAKDTISGSSATLAAAPPATPLAPQVILADPSIHHVVASSFADPADVAAFRACKTEGNSDSYCLKVGDNGIGFMGDDCTTSTPMCALPVEDWMSKWGSKENARLKPVSVTANGKTVRCLMGDTMPHRANITNGAGIDLSPAAVAALGLQPPIMVDAIWSWDQTDAPLT